MESLIIYFRSIILFLIFMNFITILLPNNKYKNYIDFVLGLILIAMVVSPITKIFHLNNFDTTSQFVTKNIYQNKYTDTTQYTSKLYENQLSNVISKTIYNNFNITPKEITVSVDETDYSIIKSINIVLKNNYITPINIGNDEIVENEDIKNIKNLISSAYNLSDDNIIITISD